MKSKNQAKSDNKRSLRKKESDNAAEEDDTNDMQVLSTRDNESTDEGIENEDTASKKGRKILKQKIAMNEPSNHSSSDDDDDNIPLTKLKFAKRTEEKDRSSEELILKKETPGTRKVIHLRL